MLRSLIIISVIIGIQGFNLLNDRIIGGEDADIQEAPYQVALFFAKNEVDFEYCCSGVIINPWVVMSSGFFSFNTTASQWMLRAGSALMNEGGQVRYVESIIIHPEFNKSTFNNDLALLHLFEPFILNSLTIDSVRLPVINSEVNPDTPGLLTGWGAIEEVGSPVFELQKVIIPAVNITECRKAYSSLPLHEITDAMMCAGEIDKWGRNGCHYDGGAPFVIENRVAGLYSWSWGCGRPGYPAIFTRISYFVNWITNNSKNL